MQRQRLLPREINVATILYKFKINGIEPHSGFLTKGDDNDDIDQTSSFGGAEPAWIEPVKKEWIIGKSVGELPWFGIIKLKLEGNGGNIHSNSERNLWIALIVIVASPFVIDFAIHFIVRSLRKGSDEDEEGEPEKEPVPRRGGPASSTRSINNRAGPKKPLPPGRRTSVPRPPGRTPPR